MESLLLINFVDLLIRFNSIRRDLVKLQLGQLLIQLQGNPATREEQKHWSGDTIQYVATEFYYLLYRTSSIDQC